MFMLAVEPNASKSQYFRAYSISSIRAAFMNVQKTNLDFDTESTHRDVVLTSD